MDSLLFEVAKYSWIVAVLVAMFLLILWLLYKINNNNIENVKSDLMVSVNEVKIDMINNANKIKDSVDRDVITLTHKQEDLSNQMIEIKDNVHRISGNVQRSNDRMDIMNGGIKDMGYTLKLISIQLGANPMDAIKESIRNQEDHQ